MVKWEKEEKKKRENARSSFLLPFSYFALQKKTLHYHVRVFDFDSRPLSVGFILRISLRTEPLIYLLLQQIVKLKKGDNRVFSWQRETASWFCHRKMKMILLTLLRWVRVAAIRRRIRIQSRSRGPPQHPLGEGRSHVFHILALTSPNCTRYQFFHFLCLLFTLCYLTFTNQCEDWESLHFF